MFISISCASGALLCFAALASCRPNGASRPLALGAPHVSERGDLASVCPDALPAGTPDEDRDDLDDECEQVLAERFAPVVYHSTDETNFPTRVERILENTTLYFYDDDCSPNQVEALHASPTQRELVGAGHAASCGTHAGAFSDGTRSLRKHRTFFLADVANARRAGSADAREWTTYFHAYKNDIGGVTVQYWRVYAYNHALNNHGGDWEGIHVVLDASLAMQSVRLLGHASIEEMPALELTREGTHPRVFSEAGGHATRASGEEVRARGCAFGDACTIDVADARTFVRQETWSGGEVRGADRTASKGGALVNLGAKEHPMNGQLFVRYSGLWGSPGVLYGTSGYWGPAFNETGMTDDGFVTAWCAGMAGAALEAECYAPTVSR